MREQIFRATMTVGRPRSEVFAFFAEAANLEAITPPELRFRILTPQPICIEQGTLIDYSLSLWGVPITWRSRIARWEPEECFVDEQLSGPYASWIHTHRFQSLPDGETRIEDEVRYRLPLGWLSAPALPLVRWQVGRIFAFRATRVSQLLEKTPSQEAGR